MQAAPSATAAAHLRGVASAAATATAAAAAAVVATPSSAGVVIVRGLKRASRTSRTATRAGSFASVAETLSALNSPAFPIYQYGVAAVLVLFATCLPVVARKLWEWIDSFASTNDPAGNFMPVRAFSVQDAQLGAVLKRKARELVSWETSIVNAAVLPLQAVILTTVIARVLVISGASDIIHSIIFAKQGCIVAAMRLPWPVYVVAAWAFLDTAISSSRNRLMAAVDSVGKGARALEPRIVTGANTIKTAVSIPMLLLLLDSVGVTLTAVWGLLGFGSVAVGLGLKDVVADLFAGLIMLTNPTFKVGDTIKAGPVQGTVMGIGATKTTLLTRTGTGKTPHTISNNVLNSQATGLVNLSLARAKYFDHTLCIEADSMDDVKRLCAAITEYLDEHPDVIHDPMDGSEGAWCALLSLGPNGILIGVKCTLRKMGGLVFANKQGDMLLEVGKILEGTKGIRLGQVLL